MEVVLNKILKILKNKKLIQKYSETPVCLTSDKPVSDVIACDIELY